MNDGWKTPEIPRAWLDSHEERPWPAVLARALVLYPWRRRGDPTGVAGEMALARVHDAMSYGRSFAA